jgi:hypothetical protein
LPKINITNPVNIQTVPLPSALFQRSVVLTNSMAGFMNWRSSFCGTRLEAAAAASPHCQRYCRDDLPLRLAFTAAGSR